MFKIIFLSCVGILGVVALYLAITEWYKFSTTKNKVFRKVLNDHIKLYRTSVEMLLTEYGNQLGDISFMKDGGHEFNHGILASCESERHVRRNRHAINEMLDKLNLKFIVINGVTYHNTSDEKLLPYTDGELLMIGRQYYNTVSKITTKGNVNEAN